MDSPAQLEKQERLKAARKTRASAAMVGIIVLSGFGCSAVSFALEKSDVALLVVVFLGIVGAVLLVLESKARFQRANEMRILRFYRSPRFYGLIITASCVLILAFVFVMLPPKHVAARPVQQTSKAAQKTRVKPVKAPPTFPELRVDGVVLSGARSIALINSKSVQLGEMYDGMRLVKVEEDTITMEFEGYQRVYLRAALIPPKQSQP
jgi:hypothetical protein